MTYGENKKQKHEECTDKYLHKGKTTGTFTDNIQQEPEWLISGLCDVFNR